jgi:hypothetical protein
VEFATVTTVMTTMSDKIAFIKAENSLIKSLKLTNATRSSLTEEQADEIIATIQAHPDFVANSVETSTSVETSSALEVQGTIHSEKFGDLLNLTYAGQSKKGFKFNFGDSFAYCNDGTLFLLADAGKLEIGKEFAFKADTLKPIANSQFFSIRLNYGADATISEVNEKIDAFQGAIETRIKVRAKKYGIDYKTSQSQVLALMQAEEDAEFKASMPKLSI